MSVWTTSSTGLDTVLATTLGQTTNNNHPKGNNQIPIQQHLNGNSGSGLLLNNHNNISHHHTNNNYHHHNSTNHLYQQSTLPGAAASQPYNSFGVWSKSSGAIYQQKV